jgi:hypothetical protein
VTRQGGAGLERNVESELILHVGKVFRCQEDGNLNRNGDGVRCEHEALDFIMPAVVVRHGTDCAERKQHGFCGGVGGLVRGGAVILVWGAGAGCKAKPHTSFGLSLVSPTIHPQ